MAIKDGGALRSFLTVISGKVVRKPAEMARAHVSRAGLKSNACINFIRLFNVGRSMTMFIDFTGLYVDVLLFIVHNPCRGLVPCMITWFLYQMYTFVAVNNAKHPESQN